MKTKLFLTALVLMAATVFANAQKPAAGQGQGNGQRNGQCCGGSNSRCKGVAFVDKNNDGICDNYESRTANTTDNKGNGNGKCDGTGKGQGQGNGKGRIFIDINKNGICDYYEINVKK